MWNYLKFYELFYEILNSNRRTLFIRNDSCNETKKTIRKSDKHWTEAKAWITRFEKIEERSDPAGKLSESNKYYSKRGYPTYFSFQWIILHLFKQIKISSDGGRVENLLRAEEVNANFNESFSFLFLLLLLLLFFFFLENEFFFLCFEETTGRFHRWPPIIWS